MAAAPWAPSLSKKLSISIAQFTTACARCVTQQHHSASRLSQALQCEKHAHFDFFFEAGFVLCKS
jgi:hypothetical protein